MCLSFLALQRFRHLQAWPRPHGRVGGGPSSQAVVVEVDLLEMSLSWVVASRALEKCLMMDGYFEYHGASFKRLALNGSDSCSSCILRRLWAVKVHEPQTLTRLHPSSSGADA